MTPRRGQWSGRSVLGAFGPYRDDFFGSYRRLERIMDMSRQRSSRVPVLGMLGRRSEEQRRLAVWEKGRLILGWNSAEWRRDDYGNLIAFSAYGNRNSQYGWEIDHITPVDNGGGDELRNLRPLQWEANVRRVNVVRRKMGLCD